ncbi:probable disease resistance protein At4g27220 [Andrographis paniculata]|uniref:probable disease resistance protein At4g27220 n=1 Tax=Andrographis paniculata TaxID=175694 RepID=UPI0021E8BCA0|nr:probable disease resistance protein At4g27220 [Andrographis paniculata]
MYGDAGALVTPAAEEVGKEFVSFVKKQFNYLCCFKQNVEKFREKSKELKNEKDDLQKRVDQERNNTHQILQKVSYWIGEASKIENDPGEIQEGSSHLNNGCCTILSHYEMSRRAVKATEKIEKLLQGRRDLGDHISVPGLPASQASVPRGEALEFSSRKDIEEGVIRAFKDENVHLIGICGMGGVGKTTLAKKVQYIAKEELGLFEEAVMVVVGQNVDPMKIQCEIAECLGLNEIKDVESYQARAHKLRERLRGTRRTLLILDDIWESISLEELGIPCKSESEGCSVLITTRNRDLLKEMDVQIVAMETLSEEEAWSLFQAKAGDCVNNSDIQSIAKEVVKECEGLPLAIINVGMAMKDENNCDKWERALDQLKCPTSPKIDETLRKIYNALRLSYDYLKDDDSKSLLQLSSQFPEDFNISLEDLILCSFGLSEEGCSLRDARSRVYDSIDKLKSNFLLMDGDLNNTVKMHDVVRDVVRFIASQNGSVDLQHESRGYYSTSCKWILEFPEKDSDFLKYLLGPNFPSLQLLLLQKGGWWDSILNEQEVDFSKLSLFMSCGQSKALEISDFSFMETMKELRVLSFKEISCKSLPQAILLLKNLRTLRLNNCPLENIDVVGTLLSLEILSCVCCPNIHEIPLGIGMLKRLRLVEFSYSSGLKRVSPGIISNLTALEELKMLHSFKGWESTKLNEMKRKNATLKELESLRKLTCLEIQIEDVSALEEEIQLPCVKRFKVLFGEEDCRIPEKALILHGLSKENIHIPNWIIGLARNTDVLSLEGDGLINFHLSQVHSTIKSLKVRECGMLKSLVNATTAAATSTDCRSFVSFRELKSMELYNLPSIKELCDGPILEGSISFNNLRKMHLVRLPSLEKLWSPNQHVMLNNLIEVYLEECNELQNLFSFESSKDFPSNLEKLQIRNCKKMKQVFVNGHTSHVLVPKLKMLKLSKLPNLTSFSKATASIEFPMLEELKIKKCPKFVNFVESSEKKEEGNTNENSPITLYLFDLEKVKFDVLEYLSISDCNNIKTLCTISVIDHFVNLKELWIKDCKFMEQVIAIKKRGCESLIVKNKVMEGLLKKNENEDDEMTNYIVFPKLESLCLEGLSILTSFGKEIKSIEFPMLAEIEIENCPNLSSFVCPMECNRKSHQRNDADDDEQSHSLFCKQKVKANGLEKLIISGCNNIRSIYFISGIDHFVNLKELLIQDCKFLEQVIAIKKRGCESLIVKDELMEGLLKKNENENDEMTNYIVFPKLEFLCLEGLSTLTSFGKRIESIEFPMLAIVNIKKCPNLSSFVCPMECNRKSHQRNDADDDEQSHSLFCKQKVKANGLENLSISGCNNIRSIYFISGIDHFVNLKELWIQDCKFVEQVIAIKKRGCESLIVKDELMEGLLKKNENENDEMTNYVKIDGLKKLQISGYEDMSNIWCRHIPQSFFISLEKLVIGRCHNIKSLFSSAIVGHLVKIEELYIEDCKKMEVVLYGNKKMNDSSTPLPRLAKLRLTDLPILGMICEWRLDIELPLLEYLWIRNCSQMESLSLESWIAPKLKFAVVDDRAFENLKGVKI